MKIQIHARPALAVTAFALAAGLFASPCALGQSEDEKAAAKKPKVKAEAKAPAPASAPAPAEGGAGTKGPVDLAAVSLGIPGNGAMPRHDFDALPQVDPDLPPHLRPVRLFSKDGRFIDARLISATSSMVTVLRLTDHKQFEIPLDTMDEPSLRRVDTWLDRDPEATSFSLSFDVKKRMSGSDSFDSLGRSLKTVKWVYDVSLTNQSRNELRHAELEYQIIYDDQVEFARTAMFPGKGRNQRERVAVDLPPMEFNGRAEFTTRPLEIHAYEYAPPRGPKEVRKDRILGIWIRVTKNGEVIGEHRSHAAGMESLAWEEEDEIEIVVRDSFREQFQNRSQSTD